MSIALNFENTRMKTHLSVALLLLGSLNLVIAQKEHGHNVTSIADIEDDFAYVAPTHIVCSNCNDTLDAYGVKLLFDKPKPTNKIWYGHFYDEDSSKLWIAYYWGDMVPKDGTEKVRYKWVRLNQDPAINNRLETKKYGGILWLLALEQIVYHVIALPMNCKNDKKECECRKQYDVIDIYVKTFKKAEKKLFDSFFGEVGTEVHKGVVHFPGLDGG